MGIGDWGLGIGDWAQSPIPNPQSPNPQSPIPNSYLNYFFYILINLYIKFITYNLYLNRFKKY